MSELSLEERTKEAKTRQYIERRKKADLKAIAHAKEVSKKHVPEWAIKLANTIAPKWYIKTAKFFLMNIPYMWKLFITNLSIPYPIKLTIYILFVWPVMFLSFVLSFIFIVPFNHAKNILISWGLSLRVDKISEMTTRLRIYKWGSMIDETTYEI